MLGGKEGNVACQLTLKIGFNYFFCGPSLGGGMLAVKSDSEEKTSRVDALSSGVFICNFFRSNLLQSVSNGTS